MYHREWLSRAARIALLLGLGVWPGCELVDFLNGKNIDGGAGSSGVPGGDGGHVGTTDVTAPDGSGGEAGGGGLPTPGCVSPIECQGITNECAERTCIDGACGQKTLKPAGTPSALQTEGDCKLAVCAEDGTMGTAPDPTDVPDDHDDCTIDDCFGATPSFEDAPAGTPCGDGGLLACDGAGSCEGCDGAADCGDAGPCFEWACEGQVCVKHALLAEGADCGSCQTCQQGECKDAPEGTADTDCEGGYCVAGICCDAACHCSDGVQDGDELGVDCGGSCLPCLGIWTCAGGCGAAALCCSSCCPAGACDCPDETAACQSLSGKPCPLLGVSVTFSVPTAGQSPTCIGADNPDGLGCASTGCICL